MTYIRLGECLRMCGADDTPAALVRQRRRAVLRLAFGTIQITGASAGLYLLLQTGASVATGIVVGSTLIVSIVSRFLFSANDRPAPHPAEQDTHTETT